MHSLRRLAVPGGMLTLVAIVLRLFDLLLMKEHLDEPALVVAWMVGAWALVAGLGALARLEPEARRGILTRRCARVGAGELTALACFLSLLFLFHWGFMRAASDGREYFVQLRSLVKDWDVDFAADSSTFGARGTAGQYPVGSSILWLPFYLAADLWLWLLNLTGADHPRNGYFNPYQRAVGLGTLVYGFAGLLLAHRIVRDYVSRALSGFSAAAVCIGTFVLYYLVVDNSMVHGNSMFAVTLFLYLWYRSHGRRTVGEWALLGAAAGLMTMVRWQNGLFVLFPGVEIVVSYAAVLRGAVLAGSAPGPGGSNRREAGPRESSDEERYAAPPHLPTRLREIALRHGVFAATGVAAFVPQLLFWRLVRGSWLAVPASDHGVRATTFEPAIVEALFSPEKGLFSWTPLTLVALVGLVPFMLTSRGSAGAHTPRGRVPPALLGGLLLAGFAGQALVNGMVRWGGHGFGARGFTNCMLVFAVGLAGLLTWLRRRPLLTPVLVVSLLVAVNLFFMRDVQQQRLLGSERITGEQIVGAVLEDIGNPFALPVSLYEAWRHGSDLTLYERLGEQRFNTFEIDFGSAADGRFLARGWSGRERAPDGHGFRWGVGEESAIVAPLRAASRYRMEVVCQPLTSPDSRPQIMELVVNGATVTRIALEGTTKAYVATIPRERIRPGHNDVVFRYRYAASPESLGLGDDARRLAVRFVSLRLLRQ